ncbi:MAG: tubulin-like doman-containing protein, partial [Microthrixaceae bacterium]
MLLIGVGGSGGKTLQLLHRELRWRLRDSGWTEGVPAGWQFIHVDVPNPPDTELPNQAVLVNHPLVGGQYVELTPKAITYKSIDSNWLSNAQSPELAKVATWRPRAEDVTVNINAGAGQFRTIGRVVSLSQANQISDAIGRARGRMHDPGVQPQLQRLTKHFGAEGALGDVSPKALLISS